MTCFLFLAFQAMDAGKYNYAIAFQERIKISDEKMEFYKVCQILFYIDNSLTSTH